MNSSSYLFSNLVVVCLIGALSIAFHNQANASCNNLTDGGQICCDETQCGSYDPSNIYSAVDPSGGWGSIEYMWLSTTDCSLPVSQWNVISGASASTYNPGAITQTTCYLRCSRRSGCSTWAGESNVVTKTVGSGGSVQITGIDPTCAGSDGSATVSYSGSCTYTVKLYDTYGDGWTYQGNTNYLTIYLNGNPVLQDIYLTGGHGPEYYYFTPGQGDVITASYIDNDGYGYENFYKVYDENMNLIFSDGCNGNGCAPSSWASIGTGTCSSNITYSWSNGGSTQSISGLSAGTYGVTVTDGSCSATGSVTLNAPTGCCDNVTDGGQICCDQSHCGPFNPTMITSVTDPSGGTGNLEIIWLSTNNCSLPISQWNVINGATGLTYNPSTIYQTTCYIRCSRREGCTDYLGESNVVTMTVTSGVNVYCSKTNGNCSNGNLASVSANASGGSSPYSYLWSNGATTSNISNLAAGTYSVTVTDANGCTDHCSKTVSTDPCCNVTDGGAICCDQQNCGPFDPAPITSSIDPSGGTGALEIIWLMTTDCSQPVSQWTTISGATGLTYDPGMTSQTTCFIRCSRRAGCTNYMGESNIATITVHPEVVSSVLVTDQACEGNIICDVEFASGHGQAVWLPDVPGSVNYFFDVNGGQVEILSGSTARLTGTIVNQHDANKIWYVDVLLTDRLSWTQWQALGGSYKTWQQNVGNHYQDWDYYEIDPSSYFAGFGDFGGDTLWIQRDANALQWRFQVGIGANVINLNYGASAWFDHTGSFTGQGDFNLDYFCDSTNTGCNGAIDLMVWGGTSPFSYSWSNGATSQDLNGLCAGQYSVTITDHNGCTSTENATVTSAPNLDLSATITDVGCDGCIDTVLCTTTELPLDNYPHGTKIREQFASMGIHISANAAAGNPDVLVLFDSDLSGTADPDLEVNEGAILIFPHDTSDSNNNNLVDDPNDTPYGGVVTFDFDMDKTVYSFVFVDKDGGNPGEARAYNSANQLIASAPIPNMGDMSLQTIMLNASGVRKLEVEYYDSGAMTEFIIGCDSVEICDGAIDLAVSGGTPAYSYNWSNGATTQDLLNVGDGAYSVTVTDASGCSTDSTFVVGTSGTLITAIASGDVSCAGACDGYADLTVSGTSGPFTYHWSNGATTEDISGLCAGTYYVTISSANGCVGRDTVTITEPTALSAVAVGTNPLCAEECDGSVNLTVSGGTPPYTYVWNTGSTQEDLLNRCEGTYSVTVTDADGCTSTASAILVDPPGLSSFVTGTDALCDAICNGEADLTVTGGTPPFSYTWSNGSTNEDVSGLCAGTYGVTVVDANGCLSTSQVSIDAPDPINTAFAHTDITCHGVCDGTIDLTISGGTPPYAFTWSNGATTEDLSGLCAGVYSVTIEDDNGCLATLTCDTIDEPAELVAAIVGSNNTCSNVCKGEADLTATGGTPPYTYLWNNGETTEDLGSLCVGTYIVTVTDNNQCSTIAAVTISQPPALSATVTPADVSCEGLCDGSIDLSVSGGTGPYSYSWSNGAGTEDLSGLCAGTYSVTVFDANNCSATASATVNEPPLLLVSLTPSDATCNGQCDGSIDATIVGGTPPYTYSWSNGATTMDLSGLCSGHYTLTVTDANGCTATKIASVFEPSMLQVFLNPSSPLCAEDCNGSIDATVSGGTPPYTFQWNNGQTSEDISNLCEGRYRLIVVDANGCMMMDSTFLSDPADLMITSNKNDVSCFGNCDGSIDINASGGTPPYTYNWNNGSTVEDLTGLCAGSYSVTVYDQHQCIATKTVVISESLGLSSSASGTDPLCAGSCDGSVELTVTGGDAPYSYQWSNGATSEDLNGVCAGIYSVTIVDAHGCSATASATLMDPTVLQASVSSTDAMCAFSCDGNIDLMVSGGTPPYSFQWSNGASSEDVSGLCAGTYGVVVTDANGCTVSKNATVGEPTMLQLSLNPTNPLCAEDCDGSIDATVSGGTPPYTFAWSTGQVTEDISNLCEGGYRLYVTDANGCVATDSSYLMDPADLMATFTQNDVSCNGNCDGSIDLTATGGTPPYSYTWSNGSSSEDVSGLCAGTYSVTIYDANQCLTTRVITIVESSALNSSATGTDPLCSESCDGSIDLTVSGGDPPYSFLWSNGATTQDLSNLCSGTYIVTVMDANGCSSTESITLVDPLDLSSSSASTDVSCIGSCDGTIDLTVTGGTPPYTYSWSDGSSSEDRTGMCAGTYSVTVFDSHQCLTTETVTISEPTALSASVVGTDATCHSYCDGSADLTVSGGTQPYSYLWSDGSTDEDASDLCAGSHSVTVTDANGCSIMASVSIGEPTPFDGGFSSTNVSCHSTCDGTASSNPSGGTPPYSYAWNTGETTMAISGLCAGTYYVNVSDANNCRVSETFIITEPSLLQVTATPNHPTCGSDCNGEADLTITGGTPPYSYSWSNGTTSQDLTNVCGGTYGATVTDANGCIATTSVMLNDAGNLSLLVSGTDVSCHGGSDGSADLTISGGVMPYTFLWSNGATTEDINGLSAGTYSVIVTDAAGCLESTSVVVTEPGQLQASIQGMDPTCGSDCNGGADLSVSGGTPPYTYSWNNGSTMEDLSNLCGGTYDVTVTDANGCLTTATVTLNTSNHLGLSVIGTDVSCHGHANGSADLTVTGGVAPYSYLWSNGETTQDVSGLLAGTYSVIVTDAAGCIESINVMINQPMPIVVNLIGTDPRCAEECDGSITSLVSGGTPPYSYSWSTGASSQNLQNLCAGVYVLTVIDANGCTMSASEMLTDPADLSLSATTDSASCNVACDGSIDLSVSGGTPPYTYNWSNGATVEDPMGLCVGNYSVTVFDANQCFVTLMVPVYPDPTLLIFKSKTNVSCYGACDGTIDVLPLGGTPPYIFTWSHGASGQFLTGVCAGHYGVTVTDALGCEYSTDYIITQPDSQTISAIVTDNSNCTKPGNGAIDLTVTGGTMPYSYAWSNGLSVEDISALSGGTFTVTVTDSAGCLISGTFIVNEPTPILASTLGTDPRCAEECDGLVDFTVSGGTAPFTFLWSNGATTEDIQNLCAGIYTGTVTDANGCTASAGATLTDPADLSLAATTDSTSCALACDGSIDLTVSGGTPPYTYSWSNGETVEDPSGLCVGIYFVTVYDANQCFVTSSTPVHPEPALFIFKSKTDVSCFGACDGTIDVLPLGGTPPYTYSWGHGASGQYLAGLCADEYFVTVTDAFGCANSTSYIISQPDSQTISAVVSDNTLCSKQGDGSIALTVTGGTTPYYYQWSNGASTEDIFGLIAGWYTVTVTDFNNCTISGSWEVLNNPAIAVNETITHATCDTTMDGAIDVSITGGTPPYDFNWSTGETTEDINGLMAGFYSLIVTDMGGCVEVFNFTVNGGSCNSFNNWVVGRDDTLTEAPVDHSILEQMFGNSGTPGNGKGIGEDGRSDSKPAQLYQNVPNPFSQTSMIRFELPENTNSALLRITDVVGRQVQLVNVLQLKDQQYTFDATALNEHNQVLFYSLFVDGKLISTKRMVIY